MIKIMNFLGAAVGILVPILFLGGMWGAAAERDMSLLVAIIPAALISFGLLFSANRLERRARLWSGLAQKEIKIGSQILSGVALMGQLILVPLILASGFRFFFEIKRLIENGNAVSIENMAVFLGASSLMIALSRWRKRLWR